MEVCFRQQRHRIKSGYRPNHLFEQTGQRQYFAGEIQSDDNEWFELGKNYIVSIKLPIIQKIENYMYIGKKWWLHEGPHEVGEAELIEFEKAF